MAKTAASTICRIENNKMRPKPELVSRIAQATGGEVVLPRHRVRRLLPGVYLLLLLPFLSLYG